MWSNGAESSSSRLQSRYRCTAVLGIASVYLLYQIIFSTYVLSPTDWQSMDIMICIEMPCSFGCWICL